MLLAIKVVSGMLFIGSYSLPITQVFLGGLWLARTLKKYFSEKKQREIDIETLMIKIIEGLKDKGISMENCTKVSYEQLHSKIIIIFQLAFLLKYNFFFFIIHDYRN